MKDLRRQARVTAFLRKSLAEGAQDVLKLEAKARREALLGERQRITHAKAFKRGKHSLRIRSVRAGFGPNGSWRWELPSDRDGARQPVRAERRIPIDWVDGVARLDDYPPPTDVPRHRWRQFVSDGLGDDLIRPILSSSRFGASLKPKAPVHLTNGRPRRFFSTKP
jgi:hypothetical protein